MPEIPTASQTVGPFFHGGLIRDDIQCLPVHGAANAEVVVRGRVIDGAGEPVTDAMLEFWHPSSGFARVATDDSGAYAVALPRPKAGPSGALPHFAVAVFARGLLRQLYTRCYLAGAADVLADGALAGVPADRRGTLLARGDGDEVHFDIVLQGPGETVFFTP